jgi:hypothetical protein
MPPLRPQLAMTSRRISRRASHQHYRETAFAAAFLFVAYLGANLLNIHSFRTAT